MPVHLSGRSADMDAIGECARRHGLLVVEDAAQSIGSRLDGRLTGTWGDVGCFSAHPLKNLNGCGDAGYVLTDDAEIADRIRVLRNAGLEDRDTMVAFAGVSRMDTIQAAILKMRLGRLSSVIERRRANAALYRRLLDRDHVFTPIEDPRKFDSRHTFVVETEDRDALLAFLSARGIETAVHYPVPIHLQPGARRLGYHRGDFPMTERQSKRILSLPIHQFLTEEQIRYVADSINAFFKG